MTDSAAWNRWPAQHQSIERARNWLRGLPQDRQAGLANRQDFFCYVQWIAHQQWRAIKSYAEERGRGADGRYSIRRQLLQR